MSCSEWMNGFYYIRNKTEYNKVIKKVVAGYNEDIAEINEAIKEYKKKVKRRDRIEWGKFSYDTDNNWRLKDFIEARWLRRGGIEKANTKTIDILNVEFDRKSQKINIDVFEGNWVVERWWRVPGVNALFRALNQVKWSQRGDKDGGYLRYWSEYHQCEGNGEPSFQNYFGRKGDEMMTWVRSRPGK